MTFPALIHEQLKPFAHGSNSYAQLERMYSTPGLPPIVVRVTQAKAPDQWALAALAVQPDGNRNVVITAHIAPQNDNGDAEADRYAALAARILREAKGAA